MGGHVLAEIVRISDKDTPARRNTDPVNVLFLWVGIRLSVGVGVGVGGKLPMSVAPPWSFSPLNLCRSYNQLATSGHQLKILYSSSGDRICL